MDLGLLAQQSHYPSKAQFSNLSEQLAIINIASRANQNEDQSRMMLAQSTRCGQERLVILHGVISGNHSNNDGVPIDPPCFAIFLASKVVYAEMRQVESIGNDQSPSSFIPERLVHELSLGTVVSDP